MATTAIGTLLPILSDTGESRTRFGTYLLAAGATAEFGLILLVTLVLSTGHPLHEALILVFFVALAVATGVLAVRTAWWGWPLIERTFETSSQLGVRLAVVLVFGLVALATQLGLDLVLGGFVAGMVTRLALRGPGGGGVRLQGHRGRVRLPDPVLLRHQRDGLQRRRALLRPRRGPEAADVRRVVPGRSRSPGAPPLPRCPAVPRSHRARHLLCHRVAAGRGDHHARAERRRHAGVHRDRPGRAAIISTLAFPLVGLRLRRDRPREPEDPAGRARPAAAML
jgi:hypothetical protein